MVKAVNIVFEGLLLPQIFLGMLLGYLSLATVITARRGWQPALVTPSAWVRVTTAYETGVPLELLISLLERIAFELDWVPLELQVPLAEEKFQASLVMERIVFELDWYCSLEPRMVFLPPDKKMEGHGQDSAMRDLQKRP